MWDEVNGVRKSKPPQPNYTSRLHNSNRYRNNKMSRKQKWILLIMLIGLYWLFSYANKDNAIIDEIFKREKYENEYSQGRVRDEDAEALRNSLRGDVTENGAVGDQNVQGTYSTPETTVGEDILTEPKRIYSDERNSDLSSVPIDYSKVTTNEFSVFGYSSFDISFYDDICEYYCRLPRYYLYEYEIQNYIDDDYNKSFISSIVSSLNNHFKEYGYSDSAILSWWVKFVQSIPYEFDKDGVGYDDWPKYPLETLYQNSGDCEDHAILLLSILKELNYDCAALLLPGHCAVGLAAENIEGSYYDMDGVKYYFIETTNSRDIGSIPDDYKDASATIIVIK